MAPGPPVLGHPSPQLALSSLKTVFPHSVLEGLCLFVAEVDTASHNSPRQGHHCDPGAPSDRPPPFHSLEDLT